MSRVELEVGEAVVVTFAGTDGEITVAHKPDAEILVGCRPEVAAELPSGISVHADLADTKFGRVGLIYSEPLGVLGEDGLKPALTDTEQKLITRHQYDAIASAIRMAGYADSDNSILLDNGEFA